MQSTGGSVSQKRSTAYGCLQFTQDALVCSKVSSSSYEERFEEGEVLGRSGLDFIC
jgi:hypothetical protein